MKMFIIVAECFGGFSLNEIAEHGQAVGRYALRRKTNIGLKLTGLDGLNDFFALKTQHMPFIGAMEYQDGLV